MFDAWSFDTGSTYWAFDNNLKYTNLNSWSECPFLLSHFMLLQRNWYPFSIAPICNSDIYEETVATSL